MEALAQVCDAHLLMDKNLSRSTQPLECMKLLKDMAVPFEEMLYMCGWRFNPENCSNIFTEIITEEGFCYTFNMLKGQDLFRPEVIDSDFHSLNHNSSSTNWSLEDGYETNSKTIKILNPVNIKNIFSV